MFVELVVLLLDSSSMRGYLTMLCLGADEIKWNMRLEEQLSGLSDAETYYLLTAINTMALSRTVTDWPFIQATTLQILEVFLELTVCLCHNIVTDSF